MQGVPSVSFVIPIRGQSGQLETTLRSVLGCEAAAVEILIVEDGPADGAAERAGRLDDQRILVIRLRPDGVPGRPFNAGLARARAPYVTFLHPGDLLKADYPASVAHALDTYPQAAVAFGDFERIDGVEGVLGYDGRDETHLQAKAESARGEAAWTVIPGRELARIALAGFIGTSGVTVRRSIITELGPIDETLSDGGDLDLWLRVSHHHSALYRAQVSHTRRVSPEAGRAAAAPLRTARDRIRVLRSERARRHEKDARRELDPLIAGNLAAIAREYCRRGSGFRALVSYAQAFISCPRGAWTLPIDQESPNG